MIRHHSRRRILLSSTAGTALALLGRQSCAFAEDFYQRWPLVQPSDVLPFIRASAKQGDAEAVVTALDVWASKYPNYGLGAEKGAILEQLFVTHAPKVALEVGSFMGYSAVRTARRLPPQGILHCIEASAANAAVVWQVVDYAGVGDRVDIVVGLSGDVLEDVAARIGRCDWVFLDHCKPCLLPDCLRMEQLGIIRPGTCLVADNVLYPGAPDFLQHVQDVRLYDTELRECAFEYDTAWREGGGKKRDAISVSIRKA